MPAAATPIEGSYGILLTNDTSGADVNVTLIDDYRCY